MQLISSVTVGAGGASSIEFSSIPQTYTDLLIKISSRSATSAVYDSLLIKPNGSTSSLSSRFLIGDGSTASSNNNTATAYVYYSVSAATSTSNTFGNADIYIINYASSNYKHIVSDGVSENNATNSGIGLNADLWTSSSAITSMTLALNSGSTFAQYSTAYLYGITNS